MIGVLALILVSLSQNGSGIDCTSPRAGVGPRTQSISQIATTRDAITQRNLIQGSGSVIIYDHASDMRRVTK